MRLRLPKGTITPDILANLKRIDEMVAELQAHSLPEPDEATLQAMEQDFYRDAVYYNMRLCGNDMTKEDVAAALAMEKYGIV